MTDDQPALREYHWIITVQWQPRTGTPQRAMHTGIITMPPERTRQSVFQELLEQVMQGVKTARRYPVVVVYFSLEPNRLG